MVILIYPQGGAQAAGPLDRLIAGVLLVLLAPLLLVIYLSVRLTSRGPAIYTQCRVGRYGRVFSI